MKNKRLNDCIRLLDNSYRVTYYDPRMNTHNTPEHEIAKCKLIYLVKKNNEKILAECIFYNGCRCDLLIPEKFLIIEILKTETEKEVLEKIKSYPKECEVKYYTAAEVLDKKFEY